MSKKPKHVYLADLHFDHRIWRNELKFYKEEIAIFEHRLEELLSKNNSREFLAELAHFQNQYIREKEVIDELNHEINVREDALVKFAKEHNEIALTHTHFHDHVELRERMATFVRIYTGLKGEFQRFSGKWM